MEATDGDGVVEEYAVVGHVEDGAGELPVLADVVAGGYVEGGVRGQVRALVGSFT